jgi:hypothetical protein
MIAKYAYYVHNHGIMPDWAYDYLEKDWHDLGIKLGRLSENDTSPCVDFNWDHPLAKQAEEEYYRKKFHVYSNKSHYGTKRNKDGKLALDEIE